ncbi:hypothetical protein ACN5L5_003780 [Cronobacter turicensis]|nr:hypothetical protein [Cronobacter turicensis]
MNDEVNESEHFKEVYAYYGLSMYRAQCVEQSIIQLLIFFDFIEKNTSTFSGREKWESDFDEFDNFLSKKTMGHLLKLARELNLFNKDVEEALNLALKKRNWLAHLFFVDHALNFINKEGRVLMINDLEKAIELFNHVESMLQPISKAAAYKYGLTEEILEQMMEDIQKSEK